MAQPFSYRYPEGESSYERFRVHKTVFPADFLGDFGFRIVRASGRVVHRSAHFRIGATDGLLPLVADSRTRRSGSRARTIHHR